MAKKKNEAQIRFTADTSEFNDQIKDSESSLKELRSELKLNASQMKKTGDNTETLKKRQKLLAKELETAKDKTEALEKKLKKAEEVFGENSEEAKKLRVQLNNARNEEQKIANEIDDTNKKLKEQKNAFDQVADKAEKAGKKLTDAGKKMSVASAGIAAVGGASIAAFNEVDEGADNVIKATGATGEAAEELEEVYGKVASSIVGDFADIGSAVGEINTRFGYTGDKLETASIKFEKFASITGVDAKEAVQAVSRALNDSGIPLDEYDTLLDQLAKAGQAAGIDVTTLANSLSTNGSIMRSMGFDTEETIALLSQFELSGADATTMLSGMKRAMANWAKEGKNGNQEFKNTVEGIKNGSISAGDALDVFGTKAGPMLVDAIKSGKFEYNDMLKTIQNSKGTVESTFDATVDGGYEMELAMQNAKIALGEVGDTLSTSLAPIVEGATENLKGFATWWGNLDTGTQNTIITIAGVVAAIGPVLLILGTVASSISKITALMGVMRSSSLLAAAAAKVQAAGQWLLNTSIAGFPIVWIIGAIAALIAIGVALYKNWDTIKEKASALWTGIKNTFQKIKDAIKLPHFSLTGEFSLIPPSVPKLSVEWYAKGGIFTRPTIFPTASGYKGVGEAGAEAVLPIDRLQGYVTEAILRSTPQQDLTPLVNAIEELADRPINLGINGRSFARATARDADSENGMRDVLADRGLVLD